MVDLSRLALASCVLALTSCFADSVLAQTVEDALPSPLHLQDVLKYAEQHRAEIVAARARASAAAQRPEIVSALEDPMVSPSLDHLPFMLHGANVSLTVEQRFPLGSVLSSRKRSAEADARRAHLDVTRLTFDLQLAAAEAYLMLQQRRALTVILQEQHALAQQLLQAALARYRAGSGSQADGLRAEIDVARLAAEVRASTEEIVAGEVMLNVSLGRQVQAAVPPLEGSPPDALPPAAEAVRDIALARRPELQIGQAEVNRARADVSVMESMYTPMAMVRTGPAYTMYDGAGWMLMVGVSVPIWRGRLRAGVEEARSMVAMAEADLLAMRRMVAADALAARARARSARERYLALRDEVLPRAQQAISPALAAYSSGQLPLVSVIEAAQALWSAQAELLAAQAELGMSWARLQRAIADPALKGAAP
jgi:cobalt-zinc-cadmium efflux system outer membrane protein